MSSTTETMSGTNAIWTIGGWFFALSFFAIGFINTFWGNDAGFGIFIILLSMGFVPPLNKLFTQITGWTVPVWAKVLLGLFILWAALGVGELFFKIDMMMDDLRQ